MAILQRIDRAIGAACRGVLYVTLAVVFVILSANVALRYVAGTSLASASELPELLFPWMIMAGVVLAAQHGSHIAIVIVGDRSSVEAGLKATNIAPITILDIEGNPVGSGGNSTMEK